MTGCNPCKRWSRHSCLLAYIKPEPWNPVSGHAKTRRRLPHRKKDCAIYWITVRLADAIPRDKRGAFKEARKRWLKRHPEKCTDAQWKECNRARSEKQYWRFVRYIGENPTRTGMHDHASGRPAGRPDAIKAAQAFLLSPFRQNDDEKGRQECLAHLHTRFLNGSTRRCAGVNLIDSRKKQLTVTIH